MASEPGGPALARRVRRSVIKGTLVLAAASAVIISLWTWAALTFVYSKGERAGFVQKFSRRGWLIKTWEGELAMVNLPGAMPQIFLFSVRDEAAVQKLKETMGRRVVLSYHEHRGLPPRIFGDTSYFIVDARPVEAESSPAGVPEPSPTPSL